MKNKRDASTASRGTPIGDNPNSLKAGLRGATLLEDFILREKITHFASGDADPGIVMGAAAKADRALADFITALGRHRHPEREAGATAR